MRSISSAYLQGLSSPTKKSRFIVPMIKGTGGRKSEVWYPRVLFLLPLTAGRDGGEKAEPFVRLIEFIQASDDEIPT